MILPYPAVVKAWLNSSHVSEEPILELFPKARLFSIFHGIDLGKPTSNCKE
jgi:hypothetical protein